MKKKLVARIIILLTCISVFVGSYHMVYADNTKLFPELSFDMEEMTEEESTYVDVYFYISLDMAKVQERIKGVEDYDEKSEIIFSMYDEIITEFLQKYYQDEMYKVLKIDYDWMAVAVEATKSQIIQFTEEDTVLYIESTPGISGYVGATSLGLLEVKVAAIADVTGYPDFSAYRPMQQQEIQAIIDKTLADINVTNYEQDIRKIVSDAEQRMDAVKTDEQLKNEEQSKITPTITPLQPEESSPTIAPSQPEEPSPTITLSQPEEPSPTITLSQPEESSPMITPSQLEEPSPTIAPSNVGQQPGHPPASEVKPTVVPPKTEQKPESEESETEKTELSHKETENAEINKEGFHTTLATITLIAVTAGILTIGWFAYKKRRHS